MRCKPLHFPKGLGAVQAAGGGGTGDPSPTKRTTISHSSTCGNDRSPTSVTLAGPVSPTILTNSTDRIRPLSYIPCPSLRKISIRPIFCAGPFYTHPEVVLTVFATFYKIPPGGTEKFFSLCRKQQLTFCRYTDKILSIHYEHLYLSLVSFFLKNYVLGGNHIEGLGIYNHRRGDGSCD